MVGVRSRQPKRDMGKGDGDEEWREDGRTDKGKKFMKGKKMSVDISISEG